MNIETNPTALEQFQAQIKAKSWPAALETLVSFGVTVRPSQAPKLRDAVRADPTLIERRVVQTVSGGTRDLIAGHLFEPDKDEHGGITADWLRDPVRLADSMPHFSTSPSAQYQIHHHVMFGDLHAAIAVLRESGLSCRVNDYGGALFRAIRQHVHTSALRSDGATIAIARTN
jgi:hypothetical protein